MQNPKRTNRSQDQDNDQTTAHVLLSRMRLNQETLVEKLHSDWEKQQNKERYVPDKARQRRKISHEPNQVNKHHDAETNLNQTSAVPPHLSQAIDIDKESEESALYEPDATTDEPMEEIPDFNNDDLWRSVETDITCTPTSCQNAKPWARGKKIFWLEGFVVGLVAGQRSHSSQDCNEPFAAAIQRIREALDQELDKMKTKGDIDKHYWTEMIYRRFLGSYRVHHVRESVLPAAEDTGTTEAILSGISPQDRGFLLRFASRDVNNLTAVTFKDIQYLYRRGAIFLRNYGETQTSGFNAETNLNHAGFSSSLTDSKAIRNRNGETCSE
ncbi:hypothetical protein RJZ56_001508 [Blastomyces dermatitidis]